MALISCFECGKEISTKALTCPQCGVPVPAEKDERSDFILFFGRLFRQIQAVCRKCRSPIKHSANICKTCGTYFPFHESNKTHFLFILTVLFLWGLAKLMPKSFGFLLT